MHSKHLRKQLQNCACEMHDWASFWGIVTSLQWRNIQEWCPPAKFKLVFISASFQNSGIVLLWGWWFHHFIPNFRRCEICNLFPLILSKWESICNLFPLILSKWESMTPVYSSIWSSQQYKSKIHVTWWPMLKGPTHRMTQCSWSGRISAHNVLNSYGWQVWQSDMR